VSIFIVLINQYLDYSTDILGVQLACFATDTIANTKFSQTITNVEGRSSGTNPFIPLLLSSSGTYEQNIISNRRYQLEDSPREKFSTLCILL
jgi:hypothetical protein